MSANLNLAFDAQLFNEECILDWLGLGKRLSAKMEQGARPELLVDMKALEANVKRIDIVCELKI